MASGISEGKTLDLSSPCENCTGNDAKYYCKQCGMDLCYNCERFHSKSNISKNHAVVSLNEKSFTEGKSQPRKQSCIIHGQQLEYICETCFVTLCGQCQASHKTHNLMKLDTDPRLLHKVCIQNIPRLMEILHEVENCSKQPHKLKLYKEARLVVEKWRTQIKSIVDAEADRLLVAIDAEIQKQTTMLENFDRDLTCHKQELDTLIDKLNNLRYTSDSDIIAEAVNDYDETVNDAKTFLSTFHETSATTATVDLILPFGHLIQKIKHQVKTIFTHIPETKDFQDEEHLQNVANMAMVDDIRLPGGTRYHISECKNVKDKTVVLYETRGHIIITLDIDTKLTQSYRCDKAINGMLTLNRHHHVITEYDEDQRRIHLLDDKFNVLDTLHNFKPGAICIDSEVSFFTKDFCEEYKTVSQFKRVVVRNGKMLDTEIGEVDILSGSKIMAYDRYTNTILVKKGSDTLAAVQTRSMDYKCIDVLKEYFKRGNNMLYMDFIEKYILIGDRDQCCIHILNRNEEYENKLNVGKGEFLGATRRQKYLIVLVDNTVKLYTSN